MPNGSQPQSKHEQREPVHALPGDPTRRNTLDVASPPIPGVLKSTRPVSVEFRARAGATTPLGKGAQLLAPGSRSFRAACAPRFGLQRCAHFRNHPTTGDTQ